MAIAKHISLNGTVIDIGGCTEVWNIVESSGTYSITGHSTPYADITSVLNKNGAVILKDSLNRYFYMAGNFGSGSEERYSFTYNEAAERRVFNIYTNNTIAYNIPADGAPLFHRSTDTTYGIGSENYYGHNKVINNITTSSYTEGESLSAYQGKVLSDKITAVTPTLPSITSVGASDVSVASGTTTNMGSITLPAGLWLITVTARWSANASGHRQCWLSTSSTGSAKDFGSVVSYPAVNGAITSEQLTCFISISSQTTYYIVVQQNSSSSITCNTRYSTCRLGDA